MKKLLCSILLGSLIILSTSCNKQEEGYIVSSTVINFDSITTNNLDSLIIEKKDLVTRYKETIHTIDNIVEDNNSRITIKTDSIISKINNMIDDSLFYPE